MLSAHRENILKEFCSALNISDCDAILLDTALTHASYLYENNLEGENYERLEFLGDSAVRLVMSDYLFDKFPSFPEGKLTKIRSYLVSDNYFSKIALELKLQDYLNIGKNEEKDGGRQKESVLACALEAVFGAIFKSCGYNAVKTFICDIYDRRKIDADYILTSYNSKEALQEYTQSISKNLPEYKIVSETGKAHNKVFETAVFYNGEEIGRGAGKTKKESEKNAAADAMYNLKLKGAAK